MIEHPPIAADDDGIDIIDYAFSQEVQDINSGYPYWDKVKYLDTKTGINNKTLWYCLKFIRQLNRTIVNFGNYSFSFTMSDEMFELLHYFDMNIGGNLTGEHLIPSDNKNTYLISSIMEEAIASSQIEGAATTRKVAKDMLRKSEKPHNKGQQMILNNYLTINHIKNIAQTDFSVGKLLEIHRLMTEKTLEDEMDEGRIRTHDNIFVMNGITGEVAHTPPHFEELPRLLSDLESFFNKEGKSFIHPIIKGIIVHFMLAFFHPFVDGNGRTSRSLFYWYMLKNGYWMVEYMSISRIISKTKTMYEKSFLYTEYDENDLTYFVLYNLRSMKKAFEELKSYLKRKTEENKSIFLLASFSGVNQRQAQILQIVHENPNACLLVKEVENRFFIGNQTARTDLYRLVELGYLREIRLNKRKIAFVKSDNFEEKYMAGI